MRNRKTVPPFSPLVARHHSDTATYQPPMTTEEMAMVTGLYPTVRNPPRTTGKVSERAHAAPDNA